MPSILVLGAGQSAPYLIQHLLSEAPAGFEVVVADQSEPMARSAIGAHPRGVAVALEARDEAAVLEKIKAAEIVVCFLAPSFQAPIARLCLEAKKPMVSASYRSAELLALEPEAKAEGLTLLSEVGLDPGLDHMSAMRMLARAREAGANVRGFWSYGSGVVDRDTVDNPFGYAITWNPRNVVMSGEAGAYFKEEGVERIVPYPEVFARVWPVEVPGEGVMEAYANRDSVSYIEPYGLEEAETVVRGTLRHVGYTEAWYAVARLGMGNERIRLRNLPERSWAQLVETFLPPGSGSMRARVAAHLGIHPGNRGLSMLEWLGLFGEGAIGELAQDAQTASDALIALLRVRLALPPGGRDLVILHHELEVELEGQIRRLRSTLRVHGEPGGCTAMAKTVGLPAALATLDILSGDLDEPGCPVPLGPSFYDGLLDRVEAAGLVFEETGLDA